MANESYPHNYEDHDCIFPPDKILVRDEEYTIYRARFNNLTTLYEYLKSDPRINKTVFRKLSSVTNDSDFAGKPYNEAVEDLISEIDPGYDEFLKLQKDLNQAVKGSTHKYQTVKTVAGGHINIPDYVAGGPMCFTTEERISRPKFVTIHVSLSYYCGTTKKQVFNRAIIITNILKALEAAGYNVNLNMYELSSCSDELAYIVVNVKKYSGHLHMSALYKTLCHVEFLRRILFRVLETLDVKNYWGDGYGRTCSEGFTRDALHLGKNDIFFDQPSEMGIRGDNISVDFERAIANLKLDDKIDVEKAKKEFQKESMSLSRKLERNYKNID